MTNDFDPTADRRSRGIDEFLDTLSVPHDVIVDTLGPAATWYLKHRASLRWGLGPDPS